MIRLIVGAALMAVMTYIGFYIEKYYKTRADIVNEFSVFLSCAERQVNFLKSNIIDIIEDYTKNNQGKINKILKQIQSDIKEGKSLSIDSPYLQQKDKGIVIGFFETLIKSDFLAQKHLFQRYKEEAELMEKTSQKQKKEKGELFKKLFILGGVGLLIVIM